MLWGQPHMGQSTRVLASKGNSNFSTLLTHDTIIISNLEDKIFAKEEKTYIVNTSMLTYAHTHR